MIYFSKPLHSGAVEEAELNAVLFLATRAKERKYFIPLSGSRTQNLLRLQW